MPPAVTTGEIRATVRVIRGTVRRIRATVGGIRGTVGAIRATVGAIRGTVGRIIATVGGIRGTVGAILVVGGGIWPSGSVLPGANGFASKAGIGCQNADRPRPPELGKKEVFLARNPWRNLRWRCAGGVQTRRGDRVGVLWHQRDHEVNLARHGRLGVVVHHQQSAALKSAAQAHLSKVAQRYSEFSRRKTAGQQKHAVIKTAFDPLYGRP